MSVMGPDGKIHQADGSWWSPYGKTDEEIQENLKTGNMPNAPDAMRVGPKHFTGSENGDETLRDFLGDIGELCVWQAKEPYEERKKYAPQITMLKVEIKNKDECVLTIDMSDDFVVWFKKKHNLKRWAPKQFTQWLYGVLKEQIK